MSASAFAGHPFVNTVRIFAVYAKRFDVMRVNRCNMLDTSSFLRCFDTADVSQIDHVLKSSLRRPCVGFLN